MSELLTEKLFDFALLRGRLFQAFSMPGYLLRPLPGSAREKHLLTN
jgi:hypothetical protein